MLKHLVIPDYYWPDEVFGIRRAETFEELRDIALGIVKRLAAEAPYGAGMVCGPITSGGAGSKEKNLVIFADTIEELDFSVHERGLRMFNQLPFESAMWRIMATPYYQGEDHLLRVFYLPIFASGYVKVFYFIAGWASSWGASWEHEQIKKLGITIHYLPDGEISGNDDLVAQVRLMPLDKTQKDLVLQGAKNLPEKEAQELAAKLRSFYAEISWRIKRLQDHD